MSPRTDPDPIGPGGPNCAGEQRVQHLRQVLLWPLRMAVEHDPQLPAGLARPPWQALAELGAATPWREHHDEYTGNAAGFHERHYNEFVTFLPYVQRFLYGEGRSGRDDASGAAAASPMRTFRRRDVAAVRVRPRPGDEPLELRVVHVDLYFFTGVEVVLFNIELAAEGLPLARAQELLYRFGRAYPGGWDAEGLPLHCMAEVEWLDADGTVLGASDSRDRDAFLAHVAERRAPRIAAHWEFMIAPLVWQHADKPGALRVRQIEYYRMPIMAWLALDDPAALTSADFMRLGLVTGTVDPQVVASTPESTPAAMVEFERRHCCDRFWSAGGAAPHTRYLCSGHSLVVVGRADSEFYRCPERGVLAQFRHQHFLLFLIAHFQKATLLMFSDRLAEALMRLDIRRPSTIKRFKRQIRLAYVEFLSFTHGYWFHELSEQAHVKVLYAMTREHLDSDALYDEVKQRIHDMNGYLDADALRRQANTVVRLTVVTIFGLIGTVTTGFLGMNLFAEADSPWALKAAILVLALSATLWLTFYTIAKSKKLSDFLDVMSDERVSTWNKLRAFAGVWRGDDADG